MNGPATVPIEGVRPILEALRAGRRRVHSVSLPETDRSPGARELRALVRRLGVPIRTDESRSGGPVARADPFPEEPFEALLASPGARFLVALDRITDVGNLGAIARTAEVAGVTGLVLEQRHAPPIGPGALRVSAGALEHLRVGRTPSLPRALGIARDEGMVVLGADPGGNPIGSLPGGCLTGDLVWVFGSEDRGLREGVVRRLSARVGIPLAGHVASLGVAAAAAYLLLATAQARIGGGP